MGFITLEAFNWLSNVTGHNSYFKFFKELSLHRNLLKKFGEVLYELLHIKKWLLLVVTAMPPL